ncbi:MAG: heme-binding domain-containing protein [Anaerolineae bacterium]|nr:heme-binding domain-containing protein [Anaerolineae bacterium]
MKTQLNWRKYALVGFGVLVVLAVLIQFIPVTRDNPVVKAEPAWTSVEARSIAKKACFDCHSDETDWPWYSKIAPISWRIANHVHEGREYLNFSEWDNGYEAEELIEVIQEDKMPPWDYKLIHSDARLTDAEKDILTAEFLALAGGGKAEGSEAEDNDDD